jgi:two-component system, chemotaxis family, chemotaxis protein CheY
VIRDALRDFLDLSGYTVDTAIHGADALLKLRASKILPSMILLDFNMPIMSGKVFVENLRSEGGLAARIPVVLMTAQPDHDVVGLAGVLSKPFMFKAVLDQIRRFQRVEFHNSPTP